MTAINPQAVRGPVTAIPVVAGKGVRLREDIENNRVVAEVDETVLWEGDTGQIISSTTGSCNLSEAATNFEIIKVYIRGSAQNLNDVTGASTNIVYITTTSVAAAYYSLSTTYTNDGSSVLTDCCVVQLNAATLSYSKGLRSSLTSSGVQLNNSRGPAIVKVVGINRVASA